MSEKSGSNSDAGSRPLFGCLTLIDADSESAAAAAVDVSRVPLVTARCLADL